MGARSDLSSEQEWGGDISLLEAIKVERHSTKHTAPQFCSTALRQLSALAQYRNTAYLSTGHVLSQKHRAFPQSSKSDQRKYKLISSLDTAQVKPHNPFPLTAIIS